MRTVGEFVGARRRLQSPDAMEMRFIVRRYIYYRYLTRNEPGASVKLYETTMHEWL